MSRVLSCESLVGDWGMEGGSLEGVYFQAVSQAVLAAAVILVQNKSYEAFPRQCLNSNFPEDSFVKHQWLK